MKKYIINLLVIMVIIVILSVTILININISAAVNISTLSVSLLENGKTIEENGTILTGIPRKWWKPENRKKI